MKITREELSAQYRAALRAYLAQRSPKAPSAAPKLGRTAVAAGLSTLDLARMHEKAVRASAITDGLFGPGSQSVRRARAFLARALAPAKAEQRLIRRKNQELLRRIEILRRHGAAIARGNRRLEREVARRKAGQVKIAQANQRYRTLFLESQVMQDKLRQLTRQIISTQEEERKKISRELHDEVVQTLVGINVELTALGKGAEVGVLTLKQRIARTRRLVEKSVGAVHRFARELRPTVLDDIGLIPALHAFSKNLATRHKLRIQMTAFGGVERLSIAKRTVLFRVAQEALNNVIRHAEATLVLIGISEHQGAIQLEICDNGKSFPVAETLLAKNNKRLGLIGMRERIEMIGGRFEITSTPRVGTTVHAEIPFTAEAPHLP
jgi:two-component system sensor histidine kinase DegS